MQPLSQAPPTPRPAAFDRNEALANLSEALTLLAHRLRARALASEDFIHLTGRAKLIATHAREVQNSRWGILENVRKMGDELTALAQQAAAAAARATIETAGNRAVADSLTEKAARIATLRDTPDSGFDQAIRAELQPLQATLVTMQNQATNGHTVSNAAADLARRAAEIATLARQVRGGGRIAEQAMAQIGASLTTFIDDATTIGIRLANANTGLSESAARMALGARDATRRIGPFGDDVARLWAPPTGRARSSA